MQMYFIQEHIERKVYHGGIGNVDAEKIFLQKGYLPILFPCHYDFSWKAKLQRVGYLLKTFFFLPAQSSVIFQFPLHAKMNCLLIRMLGFRKRIRTICFVTDIDGIKDGDVFLLKREINELRRYDCFIVHNALMQNWLTINIGNSHTSCIDFFDFLAAPGMRERKKSFEIAFAGNLEKSLFLNFLDKLIVHSPSVTFNIYGAAPSPKILALSNVHYKGAHEPYILPTLLEGSFGLVWDGDAVEGPRGSLGDYMQYISHHKLSLYILSGMPLITCTGTAAAMLVEQYGIGVSVNSLVELEVKIETITQDAYQQMMSNTKKLAITISEGKMLSKAIDELLKVGNTAA